MSHNINPSPLVSVIIPCYNHAGFVDKAIDSVLAQTYKNTEIIVVDDGSTDNIKSVIKNYKGVIYAYQPNAGLSAARNKGIINSKGKYLVFLDADDWLYQDALMINLKYLQENEKVAFVSGAHKKVNKNGLITEGDNFRVEANHYEHFLKGNFIGMHATIMYQRWVFDTFTFDTTLKACEDYDLYLKISRKYPVIHHDKYIAAYYIHDTNMSGNINLMLQSVIMVLSRQRRVIRNSTEEACLEIGITNWKNYYTEKLYNQLYLQSLPSLLYNSKALKTLFKFDRPLFKKLLKIKIKTYFKNLFK